jgi:hypothetical protein
VKAQLPTLPQTPLRKFTCHKYRVEQLFGLELVLSVALTNGAHPVLGESVNEGTGGDSTQMVRESVSKPHTLPVTSVIV